MRLQDLDYELPASQIAQKPPERRDGGRLLLVGRNDDSLRDCLFSDLPSLLKGNELLVLNNARVIPARLFGRRAPANFSRAVTRQPQPSSPIEVFLSRDLQDDTWEVLVKPAKKLPVGTQLLFGDGELTGQIVAEGEFGLRVIRFTSHDVHPVPAHFARLGHVPLPPYIVRADERSDQQRYQTVFAKHAGAVAAPTAGLHFTEEILAAIRARGAEICELTLDVGLGTFQPIRTETLEQHKMHAESYDIPAETAERICAARSAGRPVVAVGTTVVRALEAAALPASLPSQSVSAEAPLIRSGRGEATLFMYPGFSFRVVDALLTNFHLPRSTLLALVSAFAGRDRVLAAYRHAVKSGYRFYSYGDCMLIR